MTSSAAVAQDYRARLPQDEVIYFLLPDRFENGDPANDHGGLKGDRLATGFDPTHKGFFHGGDLKGLTRRLDYIQGLGATAIWLAPIFKNKPVQGPPGQESAGYHGYWVTDFTPVDPHLGTNADFKAFVDAAHARGHEGLHGHHRQPHGRRDLSAECEGTGAARTAASPTIRTSGAAALGGAAINRGFRRQANFAKLTDPNFAYTVKVPPGRAEREGPGLAQRPDLLPQPRRHDVPRRVQPDGRLRRASTTSSPSIRASSTG